jgi:hypothetical protein
MAPVTIPVPEGPSRYYPELVEGFEALGFSRIGGLLLRFSDPSELEELIEAHPEHVRDEFRESARTPETVLAAQDSSAFVGVDWFYRQPSVVLRSLLADGTLVETQRGWDHLPVPVTAMEPYVRRLRLRPEQDRSARGRHFTIVPGASPADLWDAHRRELEKAGSPAVEHGTDDQAASLWGQALRHDEAIERNAVRVFVRCLRMTTVASVAVVLVLVFTGIYQWSAHGSPGPWLLAATAACLIAALVGAVMAMRLMWRLRYVRWIRPEFRGSLP